MKRGKTLSERSFLLGHEIEQHMPNFWQKKKTIKAMMMLSLRNRHEYKCLKYVPLDADQTTL